MVTKLDVNKADKIRTQQYTLQSSLFFCSLQGLLSSLMREQANISHLGPKWIVLDGDIDPMWIESLNTVMDDNKVPPSCSPIHYCTTHSNQGGRDRKRCFFSLPSVITTWSVGTCRSFFRSMNIVTVILDFKIRSKASLSNMMRYGGVFLVVWVESCPSYRHINEFQVLTLASNERVSLTPSMRLVFEISHLRMATPATVSRAGILFVNQQDLGWNP